MKITLSARNARRARGRAVSVQCGNGSYGRSDYVTVLWPTFFARVSRVPTPTGGGPFDRCRIRLGSGTTYIAKMTMRRV